MPAGIICCDHKGNQYPSELALCKKYNISIATYRRRIANEWPLEKILTTPPKPVVPRKKPCTDHLGNSYPSLRAMYETYGISDGMFRRRKRLGWTLEECLTGKETETAIHKDHLGNEYPSESAMCRAFSIKPDVFYTRKKLNWSLEECLTGKKTETIKRGKPCRDHLGIEYPSNTAMYKAYHVNPRTFKRRLQAGWPLKDCLLGRGRTFHPVTTDHLGKKYLNEKTMCEAYGISQVSFKRRLNEGWDLKTALTKPDQYACQEPYTDVFGIRHRSTYAFCHYYKMNVKTFQECVNQGIPEKEILIWKTTKETILDEHATVLSYIDDVYYHMMIDGNEDIWTFQKLMKYINENNLNVHMWRRSRAKQEPAANADAGTNPGSHSEPAGKISCCAG